MVEHGDGTPALAGADGAHHACRARSENDHIIPADHASTPNHSPRSLIIFPSYGESPSGFPPRQLANCGYDAITDQSKYGVLCLRERPR
jgi:hypothetical protein